MRGSSIAALALAGAMLPAALHAQNAPAATGAGRYDVVLRVPTLRVDSIGLVVDNLQAHLALNARVASLVQLTAGADVGIDSVSLGISGVRGEAYLFIDLDNVAHIVNRAVATIDKNPQIISGLLSTVDTLVGTVGAVGQTLLQPNGVLAQTVNTLGQTVVRTLDTTGNILERTLDTAGKVVSQRTLGSALSLPVVKETRNAAGSVVRQVRDSSGALLELVLDQAGKITSARVLQAAQPQRQEPVR